MTPPVATHQLAPELEADADRALDILLDAELEPIVDMVLLSHGDHYEARTHDGSVTFRRTGPGPDGYERARRARASTRSPTSRPTSSRPSPTSGPTPTRTAPSTPTRTRSTPIAQLFDHPAAPDLCVIHSASHNWEDQGGHRGEHGSPGVVQARAPFVIAGKGVRNDGLVARSGRLVDVAPTICALLGVAPARRRHATSRGQDGVVRDDVLDLAGGRPQHVIGFLFDGTNPNVLYDMAARGEAPNVARLMAMGTAYQHGAMASLPTITLANHTSILTSRHPGHHGILNNAWYDRARGEQIITNSAATWHQAMETVVARHRVDPQRGAPHVARRVHRELQRAVRHRRRLLHVRVLPPGRGPADPEGPVRPAPHHRAVRAAVEGLLVVVDRRPHGHRAGRRHPGRPATATRRTRRPRFMWCNFTLTDSAMHEGGPHSEIAAASIRDSDARIGEVLAAVERAGMFDDTAFVLVADHGMEENDPSVNGDWDVPLKESGLTFRDEAYGFLYLGVS